MRIGIDAHIILPEHKRYDPKIADYTDKLISHLIAADKKREHTWVLFFDDRIKGTKKFEGPNVEVKRFPFVQYRRYLPVVYSHMLISAFLARARLDVFHSPEGLVPFLYPGKIITTFHYVPKGEAEGSLFVRTFMLGARVAFAQLCWRADRIVVTKDADRKLLVERHGYPEDHVVITRGGMTKVNWRGRVKDLMNVYAEVARGGPENIVGTSKKQNASADSSRKSRQKRTKKSR